MLGIVPIRCGGYQVCQAPGVVKYSDSQNKLPCQVPDTLQGRDT